MDDLAHKLHARYWRPPWADMGLFGRMALSGYLTTVHTRLRFIYHLFQHGLT
jgi:hypothetical protein